MPLPDPPPTLVQVPAWAGIGLVFRQRRADPSWPADWWQRNYDTRGEDAPDPTPLTEREMKIPPAPTP